MSTIAVYVVARLLMVLYIPSGHILFHPLILWLQNLTSGTECLLLVFSPEIFFSNAMAISSSDQNPTPKVVCLVGLQC